MIPYFEQPSFSLGPLSIHAFGLIVAASVFIGLMIAERRFDRLGLDRAIGDRMAWWLIAGGFLGAHLFAVIFYFPEKVVQNPLILLMVWGDISSFGSVLGGLAAVWLFFRLRHRDIDATTRARFLDVGVYVFVISLMIGRIGCSVAHDHPGTVTRFPLAISLERAEAQQYISRVYTNAGRAAELPPADQLSQMGFHDLGVYEFLYLAAVVVPIVVIAGRRPRAPGFFLALFIATYMPVRFALDFLRVSDARYAGLTPAQWLAMGALLALAGILLRRRLVGAQTADPSSPASRAPGSG
jgi:phosphatidylglycerol:prolipoprotein diacylglycerol transferase